MNPTTNELQGRESLSSIGQLLGVVEHLLNAAIQRQIWLFFLDVHDRLIEPIMPMNDHPEDPHELHEIEDLGRVSFPEIFIHRAREISGLIRAGSFVIVWERPGGENLTAEDLDWMQALSWCAAEDNVDSARLRATFLLHDSGLRVINESELA